jgi:drug/metabolite transporter (DMT)-like permease
MAALIAVVAGESITPSVGVALAACAVGISLASTPPAADTPEREVVGVGSGDLVGTEVDDVDSGGGPAHAVAQGGHDGEPRAGGRSCHSHARAIGLAIGAATAFGASLYAAGRAGSALPAAWVAAAARLIGVPVLALPLALTGRLRLIRAAVPFVVASGLCEVLGFYSYTAGARHGIAVAAVLSSQFGTVAAVAGYLLLGERISRLQLCGVAATVGGVLALSVLST